MAFRNPNGYGSIKKLSGKRRRPFGVYVTTEIELTSQTPKIDFLEDILTEDIYAVVQQQYNSYTANLTPRAKQTQKCIGYYATRQEAMIALAEYNKNPYDIDKRNTTFQQVYEILMKEKFNKMKESAKRSYIVGYKKCEELNDIRMIEMRKSHMQKIMDDNAALSISTLNNILKLLHAVYKFCLENDIVDKDYSKFVTAESSADKADKQPLTRDEVQLIWDNADYVVSPGKSTSFTGMPMMDSVLIHLYTGVRPAELLDIKKADVHLDERWIHVRGTKNPAANRIIPIHKKIIPLIEKRMSSPGENLFARHKGQAITLNQYRKFFFNPMCDHLKINHTPHECRHTFATFAAASDMNKTLLKKMIGHTAGDITEDLYTHAFAEDLVKEIDKLDL